MQATKDKHSRVGDVREFAGITFRATEYLYTWPNPSKRERGVVWTAEPIGIASRIDEAWESTSGHRFAANAVHCQTFEKAAVRALKVEAARARKARDFLAMYDAPELAEARAKVDALG